MLEYKSSDNGATIRFSIISSSNDGTDFDVEVKCPFGSARTKSSTYFYGSPGILFRAMANEWKGWNGEKSWSDLESALKLNATSDSLGHTKLKVNLSDLESNFETVFIFEAGQLENMANEIEAYLP